MNPVQQVLAQQESGSAQGQGFGQFFVAGQQAGLARRRLDLEDRQERRAQKRDDLLLPLEAQMRQAQITNLGIEAQFNKEKVDALTTQNAVMPELMRLETEFALSNDGYADPQLFSRVQALADRYPKAFAPGMPGEGLLNNIRAVPMLRQKLQQAKSMMEQIGQGERMTLSKDGMTVDKDATKSSSLPANLQEAAAITAKRRELASEQDPVRKQALQTELDDMLMTVLPAGTTTEVFDPATGNTIMRTSTGRQGAQPGGLPNSVANEQEKARLATIASAQEVRKIMSTIQDNPNAWGLRGLGMEAIETVKGVLDPDAPAPNKEAINKAELFFTQVADSFKVDTGQMSNYERQKLDKAAALTDWKGNRRSMTDKAMNLLDAVTAKHLRTSKALGKPPEDSVLRSVKAKDLKTMRDDKLMSLLDFERWYKLQQETQ